MSTVKGRGKHEGPGGSRRGRNYLTRRVCYRVGYNWNKGGRLKELRIRHLARKFFQVWRIKTFGRVHPFKARSYHHRVVIKKVFEGWKEEWWTSRKEWSLTVRADCHYRYNLYNQSFHCWQRFVSVQKEKKKRQQIAESFDERRRMRLTLDCWEVFLDMRQMKRRMLDSALLFQKLATLRSTWTLWQSGLQQRYDDCALEVSALQHWALNLQSRAWLQWRKMFVAACSQKDKESKASLHYNHGLQRKALSSCITYVHHRQAKRKPQAKAVHAWHIGLVRRSWNKWRSRHQLKQREEDRLQAAYHLAQQGLQRMALGRWKNYVELCVEETERDHVALQHHHHHLQHAGLKGLRNNVAWSRTHQLNKNVAVQHYQHSVTKRFWNRWLVSLEEVENKGLLPQMEIAVTYHSTSILSKSLHLWKERLVECKDMKELEHLAEARFAGQILPQCLSSWVEYTIHRTLKKARRERAELHNQQRQNNWAFYTWWGRAEERKEQRLSERMAVLHAERLCVQRTWIYWRRTMLQKQEDRKKQKVSDTHYKHKLLHKTLKQWKDNVTDIHDRRNRESHADHHGELLCMRRAMSGWRKYAQYRREKNHKGEQMKRYHENQLLKQTLQAWKDHQHQAQEIYGHVEECYSLQQQQSLRRFLSVWRENATLLAKSRIEELRAERHFCFCLQAKVLLAWRRSISCAVSKRHQQREILSQARSHIDHLCLQKSFRRWRAQRREVLEDRTCMEKATGHFQSVSLCKTWRAWSLHHQQQQHNKRLKQCGTLLLRQKIIKHFFEGWKVALQYRRREIEQTELALWHWSLSLQAKVLEAWRLWLSEHHRKQKRLATAVTFYRHQLLREGVTHVLTHTAHVSSFSTSIAQHSQEQNARRLQRVVLNCAMKWKQRALCSPNRVPQVRAVPPKKSVTFCLPTLGTKDLSYRAEEEAGVLNQLVVARASRLQPRRPRDLLDSPVKELLHMRGQAPPADTNSGTKQGESQTLLLPQGPYPDDPRFPPRHIHVPVETHPRPPDSTAFMPIHVSPVVTHPELRVSHPEQSIDRVPHQNVLLPPSSFMTTLPPNTTTHGFCAREPSLIPSSLPGENEGEEEESIHSESDPGLVLSREMLDIRLDMQRFKQNKKQLQTWQKLKEVLKNWLQSSASEKETEERKNTSQELVELEERIRRLSAELTEQKPVMRLHAARVHHIESVLLSSEHTYLRRTPEQSH